MPKRTYKIQGYHGGISSDTDPRDIQDIESPALVDASIDSVGRIKTLGSASIDAGTSHALTILPNRGLFTMDSDKQLDGESSNETFLIAYDDNNSAIDIKDSDGWEASEITGFDSDLPVFYVGDGNLRVGDGEFDDAIFNKWFGYIDGHRFASLNAGYAQPEKIKVACVADSSDSLNGKYFDIYGADNHKTQVWIDVDNSGTSQPTGSGSYIHNIEVTGIATDDNANTVATQVASSINANAEFGASASGNIVTITLADNGLKTDATAGDSGFTITISQQGTPNGSVGDMGWSQANQSIAKPVIGNCLISTPFAGSDGNTVNSASSEYDGDVADDNGNDVADVASVNLRVGVPYRSFRGGNAASYGTLSNANRTDTLPDGSAMDIYPLFGNHNVYLEGTSGTGAILHGQSISFTLNEEKNIIFGIWVPSAKYTNLKSIEFRVSETTSSTNLIWEFSKEDLEVNCWNIVSCNQTNITEGDASGVGLDSYQLQIDRTGTDCDVYFSGPIISDNPGLEGYQSGLYTFYHTYLYDDEKQESLPFLFTDTEANKDVNKVNIVGNSLLFNFDMYINPYDAAGTYTISKRITGSRIYYKREENDNFYLIGELDFVEKGFKWLPEAGEMAYNLANTAETSGSFFSKAVIAKGISSNSANLIDTYRSINGYAANTSFIDAKFKTAVLHGRRVYIGNVRQPSGSGGKNHPDRMLKSAINQFDVFPDKVGAVDVAINDGESIVKLEAFADRILQFKDKTMYVINVSESVDFLEDTHKNKGCKFDYHVTKTDYGIAWFNSFGVYFYDGKQVLNLLEKGGMRLISESDWEAFITDGEDGSSDDADMSSAHIGYIPKKRQLLIKNENSDVFIYDFVLRAWMKGSSKIPITTNMTNFVLDGNQDLLYLSNNDSDRVTWNPDAASSNAFVYQTKDIDFGEPGVRKKIYKVYVTYKTESATNVEVKYDVDGGTAFNKTFQDGENFTSDELDNAGSGVWTQAILKPSTSSEANNKYSFALKFSAESGQTVPSTFEINDISIVYRTKTVR